MENQDDLPPDLEDFQEVIEKINPQKKETNQFTGDYTKTTDEINEEIQQNLKIQQKKIDEEYKQKQVQENKQKKNDQLGFKKGFLGGGSEKPKKKQNKEEITELKIGENQKQKNKFEIPEVQQAMKMNDYLQGNKNEWMTPDLLQQISQNPKLIKAFSNPEYMNAITQMQKNPKEVLAKYGKNPEFMMILQEFTKIMGSHFEEMSSQEKAQQQQTQHQQNMDKDQMELQKRLQDPEVMQIMQDEKVRAFFEYLQKNRGADFTQIMAKDPQLATKLNILIKKGVINLQSNI